MWGTQSRPSSLQLLTCKKHNLFFVFLSCVLYNLLPRTNLLGSGYKVFAELLPLLLHVLAPHGHVVQGLLGQGQHAQGSGGEIAVRKQTLRKQPFNVIHSLLNSVSPALPS